VVKLLSVKLASVVQVLRVIIVELSLGIVPIPSIPVDPTWKELLSPTDRSEAGLAVPMPMLPVV